MILCIFHALSLFLEEFLETDEASIITKDLKTGQLPPKLQRKSGKH